MSTRAVHQPQSAKQNHIWHCGISTTISRVNAHLAQQAMTFSKAKIQLAPPYINKERQSKSASGRHSRVDQGGISTAISKAKAYLVPRYVNHDQQSESTSGTAGHDGRACRQTKIQLAQPYINKEQQSESASGRHSRVHQSGISTAISKAKAYLAPRHINHHQLRQRTSDTRAHDW